MMSARTIWTTLRWGARTRPNCRSGFHNYDGPKVATPGDRLSERPEPLRGGGRVSTVGPRATGVRCGRRPKGRLSIPPRWAVSPIHRHGGSDCRPGVHRCGFESHRPTDPSGRRVSLNGRANSGLPFVAPPPRNEADRRLESITIREEAVGSSPTGAARRRSSTAERHTLARSSSALS